MTSIQALKQLSRAYHKRVDQDLDIPAVVQNSDDLPTGKVRVWRTDIRRQVVVNGTQRREGLDVILREKRGGVLQIVGTNVADAANTFGDTLLSAEQPPVDFEVTGSVFGSRNFKPGLVRPWYEGGLGLFVYVQPVSNLDQVIGGFVDVSAGVPGSVGQQRLAVVYYDMSADALGVVNGTPVTSLAPFTLVDVVAIALGDTNRIRLGAVVLSYGQTTIDASTTFIDARDWLNIPDWARPGALGSVTPNTVKATTGDFTDILTSESGIVRKVRVVTAAGAVAVTSADDILIVNKTVGAATTVNLPATPTTGQTCVVHDGKGDAATNNLTLTPAAGTINGAGTLALNVAYGTAFLWYDGTQWQATVQAASGGVSVTDGSTTVTGVTALTFSGATVSGSTPNATVTVSGGGGSTDFLVAQVFS